MSKRKVRKQKEELSNFVLDCIADYKYTDARDAVKEYLDLADGSLLPEKYEYEIHNLFSEYPNLMKLICCACEEKGYNSF